MIDAPSIAPPSRDASEYVVASSVASWPVALSSLRSLIPDQKDPNASHGVQFASKLTLGSIALKSSELVDWTTNPWSVHEWPARSGVVTRPMTEVFDPNVDPA